MLLFYAVWGCRTGPSRAGVEDAGRGTPHRARRKALRELPLDNLGEYRQERTKDMKDGIIGYVIKKERTKGHIIEITKRTAEAIDAGYAPFAICIDFSFHGTADTLEHAIELARAINLGEAQK